MRSQFVLKFIFLFATGLVFCSLGQAQTCRALFTLETLVNLDQEWRDVVAQRLAELMEGDKAPLIKRVTNQELGDAIGVSNAFISNLIHAHTNVTLTQATQIAKYLHTSVSRLFIRESPNDKGSWIAKDSIPKNAFDEINRHGRVLRQPELALELGISQKTVSFIINGKEAAPYRVVKILAQRLNIDVENGFKFAASHPSNAFYRARPGALQRAMRYNPRGEVKAYSQSDIAQVMGVEQFTVSAILRAARPISVANAQALAANFGVEVDWILAGDFLYEKLSSSPDIVSSASGMDKRKVTGLLRAIDHLHLNDQ